MQWEDTGYIITQRPFSERAYILDVFTEKHGKTKGLVKGSKKSPSSSLQIGIGGKVKWTGRLEEHLGTFSVDPKINLLPFLFLNPSKLSLLKSLTSLLSFILPENYSYPDLFYAFEKFLIKSLIKTNPIELGKDYINLEIILLETLGFGLNFHKCALTGSTENICYISPKTGKGCSLIAGEPYKENLLKLPQFLSKNKNSTQHEDIKQGLILTGHFLQKNFFLEREKRFTELRNNIFKCFNLENR